MTPEGTEMDEKETPIADLSLDALVAGNKCAAALLQEKDRLQAENTDIAAKVAELVIENDELKKDAAELATIKAEAHEARLVALTARLPENSLSKEELEAASNEELARYEKLFPETAEDSDDGDTVRVVVHGDRKNAKEGDPLGVMPDSGRYFGQPQGTIKE